MNKKVINVIFAILVFLVSNSCGSTDSSVQRNVMIPMQDGIKLATDIYFPAREGRPVEGRCPVVLTRTPYDKRAPARERRGTFYAERGYVAAMQDVRGRYASDGIFYAFRNEAPDGYDTVLDDESKMSIGQRQQLTIARAVVQNAPLLILDEATSSVDTRTEKIIQKAMDDLTVGRTSFIIAHRLSTIKDADTILVMRNGNIVESGSHEELLSQGGFYNDLYNSQFEECD